MSADQSSTPARSHRIRNLAIYIAVVILLTVVAVVVVITVDKREQHAEIKAYHPPFRACGDQLHDCQAYFKPVGGKELVVVEGGKY